MGGGWRNRIEIPWEFIARAPALLHLRRGVVDVCVCWVVSCGMMEVNYKLGGGNSIFFIFHPENWGRFPI